MTISLPRFYLQETQGTQLRKKRLFNAPANSFISQPLQLGANLSDYFFFYFFLVQSFSPSTYVLFYQRYNFLSTEDKTSHFFTI